MKFIYKVLLRQVIRVAIAQYRDIPRGKVALIVLKRCRSYTRQSGVKWEIASLLLALFKRPVLTLFAKNKQIQPKPRNFQPMSLLAKIDALQQEMWSLCDVDEDTPEADKEVRQIMGNLVKLYQPLARIFHPIGSGTHNLIEMVLLCGINGENLGEDSALRPK